MSVKVVGIDIEPFGQQVNVFFDVKKAADVKRVKTYMEKNYDPIEPIEIDVGDVNNTNGTYYYFACEKGFCRCIVLSQFDLTCIEDIQNIVHELYHCIYHVLEQVEVESSDPFDELTAYMLDCNLGKFLTRIKDKDYEELGVSKKRRSEQTV